MAECYSLNPDSGHMGTCAVYSFLFSALTFFNINETELGVRGPRARPSLLSQD